MTTEHHPACTAADDHAPNLHLGDNAGSGAQYCDGQTTTEQARAERARAHLAGEHFAPGDDYGRWLADAPDEYGIPTTMVAEGRYKVCKYLLIEEDSSDGDAIYCTGHDDPDEAVNYHYNQEYPGDWTIREIVDLDTGKVHKVAAVKMVVTWELEG